MIIQKEVARGDTQSQTKQDDEGTKKTQSQENTEAEKEKQSEASASQKADKKSHSEKAAEGEQTVLNSADKTEEDTVRESDEDLNVGARSVCFDKMLFLLLACTIVLSNYLIICNEAIIF